MRKYFGFIVAILFYQTLSAQRFPDLGIRFSSANYNRIQIEFRTPVKEFSYLRFGLSQGQQPNSTRRDVLNASDSIVTIRQKDLYGAHYDFRFGFERNLSYDWLTFHVDGIFAYSRLINQNWNYYHVYNDSSMAFIQQVDSPFDTLDYVSYANNSILGVGAALGLSFNFTVNENFMISFTGNYTGMYRWNISQQEINDVYNEFEFNPSSMFEVYPSVGVGLRYVFTIHDAAVIPGEH